MFRSSGSVKLIDVSKEGQFRVTKDGGKILASAGAGVPLNLVFIFGNARSGKSFLMNQLLSCASTKQPTPFKVINSATPCTKGVDISPTFVPHSSLKGSSSTDKLLLGFVDVEGQGDAGERHDTLLSLPLLLTSRVVLFNHKGAPTVSHMLERLGVLARAAQKVQSGLEEGDEAKSPQAEESDAKSPNSKNSLFGHLHICFRDFTFDGTKEALLDQVMHEEVVPRVKTIGYDPSPGIIDRNEIRRLVKAHFKSVSVWLFPQPAEPAVLKEHAALPPELVSEEFNEVVRELFDKIVAQTATPQLFNEKELDGPRLKELHELLIQSINTNLVIDVPSVFRAMETQRLHSALASALLRLDSLYSSMEPQLPLAASYLAKLVAQASALAEEEFESLSHGTTLTDELKVARAKLQTRATEKKTELEKKNDDKGWVLVESTLKVEAAKLRDDFRDWCVGKLGCEPQLLDEAFERLKQEQRKRIAASLAGVPQLLTSPEYETRLAAADEKAISLLQVKHAQNHSALLDIKNQQVQQEAEAIRLELSTVRERLEKAMKDKEAELQAKVAERAMAHPRVKNLEEKSQEYDFGFEHFCNFTFAQFERARATLVTARKKKLPVLLEQISQFQTWQVLVADHLHRFAADLQDKELGTKDRKTNLTKIERTFKSLKLDDGYLQGLTIAKPSAQAAAQPLQVPSALETPKSTVKIHL